MFFLSTVLSAICSQRLECKDTENYSETGIFSLSMTVLTTYLKDELYHLQLINIREETVTVCMCPAEKKNGTCFHKEFLSDFGEKDFLQVTILHVRICSAIVSTILLHLSHR